MERLSALCLLCACNLGNEYPGELDRLFLENPEDDLLLELENLGGDYDAAWEMLSREITDNLRFEKELFKSLGKYYDSGEISLREFAVRCNDLVEARAADYIEKKYSDLLSGAFKTFCWLDDAVEGVMAADEAKRVTEAETDKIKRDFQAVFALIDNV